MKDYEDPEHSGNSAQHWHTGKTCVETECTEPAGTYWSQLWCVTHNAERMRKIDAILREAKCG